MAYKFQRGLARLSGSVLAEEGFQANSAGLSTAGAIAGATTIAASGLASVGSLAVDDTSTIGCDSDTDIITLDAQEVSFANDVDVIVGKAGGLNLADGAVTSTAAELNLLDGVSGLVKADFTKLAAVDSTAAELNLLDAITRGSIIHGNSSGASALLAKGTAHQFLQSDGTDIAYVSMSGDATLAAGVLSIGATKVTDAMLNDDVATGLAGTGMTATSGIVNVIGGDGITANANDVAVTAAQTTITSVLNASLVVGRDADNKVDFGTDNIMIFSTNGSERLRITDTGNTVVKGNLLVEGTTTTIDSTTINISSSFTFEGPADAHETTLAVGTPAADTTIQLPEFTSAGTYFMAAFAADPGASGAITATPAELNLLDAGVGSTSVTIADTDNIILFDDSDSDAAKKIVASDLKSYVAGAAIGVEARVDGNSLTIDKVAYVADRDGSGQSVTLTLPASDNALIGKSVYVKAGNLENNAVITINTQAGDQKIDSENSIVLESPYASVRLVYIKADDWRVF